MVLKSEAVPSWVTVNVTSLLGSVYSSATVAKVTVLLRLQGGMRTTWAAELTSAEVSPEGVTSAYTGKGTMQSPASWVTETSTSMSSPSATCWLVASMPIWVVSSSTIKILRILQASLRWSVKPFLKTSIVNCSGFSSWWSSIIWTLKVVDLAKGWKVILPGSR